MDTSTDTSPHPDDPGLTIDTDTGTIVPPVFWLNRPESPSISPATSSTSPECISWLHSPAISLTLNPANHNPPRHPHCEGLRRTATLLSARRRLYDGVPDHTPWPPGATGWLWYPRDYRPGAKGLKTVGLDVMPDYPGPKTEKGCNEWFVPQTTRMGWDAWTVDGSVRGGIRVDDDGVLADEDEAEHEAEHAADAETTEEEEGLDAVPDPGYEAQSYHGLKRDYEGYVSDDSDSDSDSDFEVGLDAESEADGNAGVEGELKQDADGDDKIDDPFDDFDGDHGGFCSDATVEAEDDETEEDGKGKERTIETKHGCEGNANTDTEFDVNEFLAMENNLPSLSVAMAAKFYLSPPEELDDGDESTDLSVKQCPPRR
ncbi:hypothetical protein SLS58_000300 [Diplodia intermedia]|uniref:Uncharacterized protein n=1 Tax=Diplodia intermedia TaxID=856260 RepID=A0ABR3U626_9PEZI